MTHLSCDGIINDDFVAYSSMNPSVNKFWKSVNIWQSYGQNYNGLFFLDWQCIYGNYGPPAETIWRPTCMLAHLVSWRFRLPLRNYREYIFAGMAYNWKCLLTSSEWGFGRYDPLIRSNINENPKKAHPLVISRRMTYRLTWLPSCV